MILFLYLKRRSTMFDKVGQRAEEFATGLSRRAYIGKLGHAALPMAAALAGLLVLPTDALAVFGIKRCCRRTDGFVCYIDSEVKPCPKGTTEIPRCTTAGGSVPRCGR